jgi:murein L,D-transpeptidase YafK
MNSNAGAKPHWSAWRAISACVLVAAVVAGDVAAMGRLPAHRQVAPRAVHTSEALLVHSLLSIRENRLSDALAQIDTLLAVNPNFRLAQLIKGDLLLARAKPLDTLGNAAHGADEQLSDLRAEALARLQRYHLTPPQGALPKYLVQMVPEQTHAIVVDSASSTLYLFENYRGELRYAADYYVTVGKNGIDKLREGDKRTPLGVYHVTAELPRKKLTDFYGAGAWPLNYPNEWDRREGRAGHGIWLHGTPRDTYSRPPRASDGCLVLSNEDLSSLARQLQPGLTPVVIASNIEWVTPRDLEVLRRSLAEQVERWREDWESRDAERYLAHYASSFSAGGSNLARWAAQKRAAAAAKKWVKVQLTGMSIFLYPGREDLALVTFTQDYRSNNLANQARKRQFWIQEGGRWKIAYEDAA